MVEHGRRADADGAVVVVGSISRDVVAEVDRLPVAGETVLARRVRRNTGGKGSNQAVAAALAGATTRFVGRLGQDDVAAELLADVSGRGVDVSGLRTVPGAASGVAYVVVADDNQIVVDPGANLRWDDRALDVGAVERAVVLVCQLEVPIDVVSWAIATTSGRVLLNAAPAAPLPPDLLPRLDPLVVNRDELGVVAGMAVHGRADVGSAQRALLSRGVRSVVTTLGGDGASWATADDEGVVAAPSVPVVDTTGAGDAFVGYLAAGLARGADLADAAHLAVRAASWSVQHPGTHSSYPRPDQLD